MINEKKQEMIDAYEKIGSCPELFALTESALREDANRKISSIERQIFNLQKKADDSQIAELKTAIINENKQKHNEEVTNLCEQLEEKLSADEIKKYVSMVSAIESCESYSDYKCPEEFSNQIVIGSVSFDYYNDPKISQFKYITDAVD